MKKLKIPRSLVLLIVFFIMFSILIVRLFQLQIVKGQEYENNFILQTKREIVLSGARGNIYDRNGKPLATNKLANSVTFEDQETYNSDRERQLNLNSKIYQMIRIIKSKGDSIETSLKIIIDPNGNFQFSVDDFWLQRFKADVYGKANIDDMEAKERNSTADEIVSYLANQMDNKYYYKIYNNASLPLFNRATQQLSAPGSTFKPVTIIAGLEEGVIDESTMVECDGVFDKVDPPLKCWNHAGHGAVNGVDSALKNSCNDYLCEVSYRLGMIDNDEFSDKQALNYIQEYAKMFDLDEKSGIELTESKPKITDNYAIPSAIGQGTNNFSTVQLGRYVTTLANEGTSFQLSLIDKIDGVETSPKVESQIEINKRSWEGVHAGMELYTQSTGIFDGFPISVAGKSGTAQEVKNRPDHGLFIGYAPADDPEIAVAVRIVNGYEAGNAVECGKNIFEYYFGIE